MDPHITIKDTIVTKVLKLATVAALTLAALSAQAASEPAVIYDTAGKFDKSFNEAVFRVVWPAVATAPSSPSASTWAPR